MCVCVMHIHKLLSCAINTGESVSDLEAHAYFYPYFTVMLYVETVILKSLEYRLLPCYILELVDILQLLGQRNSVVMGGPSLPTVCQAAHDCGSCRCWVEIDKRHPSPLCRLLCGMIPFSATQ